MHEMFTLSLINEFLVSKETVVLRRWERSKQDERIHFGVFSEEVKLN